VSRLLGEVLQQRRLTADVTNLPTGWDGWPPAAAKHARLAWNTSSDRDV